MTLTHRPDVVDSGSDLATVVYHCNCKTQLQLNRLFFCRTCAAIRCPYCVITEIDLWYCPNCLENVPSAEARQRRNRCPNCYECPICFNPLFTRATIVPSVRSPLPSDDSASADAGQSCVSTTTKKLYYLACARCRWTTRDVGLPDKESSTGSDWTAVDEASLRSEPIDNRFDALLSYHKAVAQRERLIERDGNFCRNRYLMTGHRMSAYVQSLSAVTSKSSDKLKAVLESRYLQHQRLMASLTSGSKTPSVVDSAKVETNPYDEPPPIQNPSVAVPCVDLVAGDDEDSVIDYSVTTIEQRLRHYCSSPLLLDSQHYPISVDDVMPRNLPLSAKLATRCRSCLHNLLKSEYKPSSIKFKIKLVGPVHVPSVKVLMDSVAFDKDSKTFQFVIRISNPSPFPTQITVSQEKCPSATGSDNFIRLCDVEYGAIGRIAFADIVSPDVGPLAVGACDEAAVELGDQLGVNSAGPDHVVDVQLQAAIRAASGRFDGSPVHVVAPCYTTFNMAFGFTDVTLPADDQKERVVPVNVTVRLI